MIGLGLRQAYSMGDSKQESLKLRRRDFAEVRDWGHFLSLKKLSMSLSAEVHETVEHFQWLTKEQSKIFLRYILGYHLYA